MTHEPTPDLRMLVIDDEKSITEFLKISLRPHGYKVVDCHTAMEGLHLADAAHPDVIILDLGLPDMDGIALLKLIRKKTNTPLLILSVKEDEADKIAGLDNGADDYLVKPFSINELLARLRAVLRRIQPVEESKVFKKGLLQIDFVRRIVQIGENRIHLSPIEYDLLRLLIINAGKVMTHSQLYQKVWQRDAAYEGMEHLLRVTISNLRAKLEPVSAYSSCILTEPGIGYRFDLED
jgi:two-component system, OmpR family, KDP operon response regulator KdpE